MANFSYPLITWGTPDTTSNFATVGNSTITNVGVDPFLSSSSLKITGAAVGQYVTRSLSPLKTGRAEYCLFVSGGISGSVSQINLYDTFITGSVLSVNLYWDNSGLNSSSYTGSGALLTTVNVGNSWSLLRMYANSLTATHTNSVQLLASNATKSGSFSAYFQNAVVMGYPCFNANYSSLPRDGSTFVQAPSGLRDAWIVGVDEQLTFDMKYLRIASTDQYEVQSSYHGQNENTGFNCGFKSLIAYGQTNQTFYWVPNRASASVYISSYLDGPVGTSGNSSGGGGGSSNVTMEQDGTFTITVSISNPDGNSYSL